MEYFASRRNDSNFKGDWEIRRLKKEDNELHLCNCAHTCVYECEVYTTDVLELFSLQLKSHLFLSYTGTGTEKSYYYMCYQIYQNHHSL